MAYRENELQDDGKVHAHVSSVRLYLAVFGGLILFTLLTVLAGQFHLGPLNVVIAIAIASAKAALVVTFFMHLSHDRRFNAILLIGGLLFIGVFFAYTFNDTQHRAEIDPNSTAPVYQATGEKAPGGNELPAGWGNPDAPNAAGEHP